MREQLEKEKKGDVKLEEECALLKRENEYLTSELREMIGGEEEEEVRKRNPWLLKAFVEVCETMISIKAYCEEGVFRIPGMRVLVTGYTARIQLVCETERIEV